MSIENKIGLFGNTPTIEFIRDVSSVPLHLLRYDVQGQENLNEIITQPSLLYFFPHSGHFDPYSIRFASPKNVRRYEVFPAAKDYWYKNKTREIIHSLILNTYPMERQNSHGISEALNTSRKILDGGYSLVIAPEGTRNQLSLGERILLDGATDLALQGGYPIIPIRLKGFEEIWPKGEKFPNLLDGWYRHNVSVTFGELINVAKVESYSTRRIERKNLTNFLKDKLLKM